MSSGKELLELSQQLAIDPASQFFLRSYKDLQKKHILYQLKTSSYRKDNFLHDLYKKGQADKTILGVESTLPYDHLLLPKQKLYYGLSDTAMSTSEPLQLFQADLADFRYLKPHSNDSNYALVIVDVYSQRVYTYGIHRKSDTVRKMQNFFHSLKTSSGIRMQVDLGGEFHNREMKQLFSVNKSTLYSTKMNHGHAFYAEQKIRELKKYATKLKSIDKTKRVKEILNIATLAINNQRIKHIGLSPLEIERAFDETTSSKGEKIAMQLYVGTKNKLRRKTVAKYDIKRDKNTRNRLLPLKRGDQVFVASGRLKKTEYRSRLDKTTSGKKEYFNTSRTFTVVKRVEFAPGYFWYTLEEFPGISMHERFYRDELYKI